MKKSLTIIAAMVCAIAAFAKPVDSQRAAQVATRFFQQLLATKGPVSLTDCSSQWTYSNLMLFTRPQGGFVIVAADDVARPVKKARSNGTRKSVPNMRRLPE